MKLREKIIVDKDGKAVSVVLSVRDYGKLLALVSNMVDSAYIRRHRKDPKRPFSEFKKELSEKGLV